MTPRRPSRRVLIATLLATAAGAPAGAPAQTTLRVAVYNIKHGRGMDGVVDLERLADVLGPLDADLITLQEVDRATERTDRVDQPAVLGKLLGMEPSFGAHRPYQGGEYGNAVLSRFPVLAERTYPIAPSSGSALTVHEVVVGVGAGRRPVSVVSVHLAGSGEVRLQQVDSLRSHLTDREHPVVLAGDFNSRPGDPVLDRLREDWTVVPKDGAAATFPSDAPDREIDFVLFRPADAFEVVEHRVIEETAASDHRPLLAVLRLRRRDRGAARGGEPGVGHPIADVPPAGRGPGGGGALVREADLPRLVQAEDDEGRVPAPRRSRQGSTEPGAWVRVVGRSSLLRHLPLSRTGRNAVGSTDDTLDKPRPEWGERLPRPAYRVLFEEGTERAGSSPLNREKRAGTFVCAACHLPLFSSDAKYESGTGWPSFFRPLEGAVETTRDFKLVLPRTEYHCRRCGGHQGHVFEDGPEPTGLRYCNNGLALRFVPEGEPLPDLVE